MTEGQPQNAQIIRAGEGKQDAVPLGHEIYLSRDISNAYRVLTPAGDVLVNTGIVFNAEENFRRLSAVSSNPVKKDPLHPEPRRPYRRVEMVQQARDGDHRPGKFCARAWLLACSGADHEDRKSVV
jgi:hypothetical protein